MKNAPVYSRRYFLPRQLSREMQVSRDIYNCAWEQTVPLSSGVDVLSQGGIPFSPLIIQNSFVKNPATEMHISLQRRFISCSSDFFGKNYRFFCSLP